MNNLKSTNHRFASKFWTQTWAIWENVCRLLLPGTSRRMFAQCLLLQEPVRRLDKRTRKCEIFWYLCAKKILQRHCIVWFQKISIPPPRMVNGNSQGVGGLKGRSFQGVWGIGHVKNFQEALTSQIVLHKLTVNILICSAQKPRNRLPF